MIRASFRCLVTSVTLLVSASSISFAEGNKWAVDYVTEENIHASVNGQVTHGDKLMVRFVKGYCDKGNLLTTVYTVADHPDIMTLKDKLLPVNFIGMNIKVKAIYIAPFLSGHRVMVDIGWVAPKDLKHYLGKQEPITLAFKDYKGTAINEYFDIPENAWSSNNLSAALDKAQDMCLSL